MIAKGIAVLSAAILVGTFLTPALADKGSTHAASTPQQKYSSPYKPSGTAKGGNAPGVLSGKRVTGQKVLNLKKNEDAKNTAGQRKKEDVQNKKREQNETAGQQQQNKPQANQTPSSPLDGLLPKKEPEGTGQKAPADTGTKEPRSEDDARLPDDHKEIGATGGVSGASSQDVQRVQSSQ